MSDHGLGIRRLAWILSSNCSRVSLECGWRFRWGNRVNINLGYEFTFVIFRHLLTAASHLRISSLVHISGSESMSAGNLCESAGFTYHLMDQLLAERYLRVPKLSTLQLLLRQQKSLDGISNSISDQVLFQYQGMHSMFRVSEMQCDISFRNIKYTFEFIALSKGVGMFGSVGVIRLASCESDALLLLNS